MFVKNATLPSDIKARSSPHDRGCSAKVVVSEFTRRSGCNYKSGARLLSDQDLFAGDDQISRQLEAANRQEPAEHLQIALELLGAGDRGRANRFQILKCNLPFRECYSALLL